MSTVVHRFQSMARAYPKNDALYVAGAVVSYAELAARTESIRRAIAATESADDKCIGVLTGDDLDTYASILTYLKRFFDEIELPELRYSLFCGEALPQSMIEAWSACVPNATIQNVYGPTEATIYCLIYPWRKSRAAEEAVNGVVAIGRPMPGMRAIVIDENGALLPAGEKGELCLHGDQVTDRYWQDPEKTAAAFVDIEGVEGKAYRTGDLALVNARGNFVYHGRLDFQVKIDGHRIELGEIEHFARQFARGSASESAAVAIALTDDEGRTTLKLFIDSADVAVDELRAYLKARLPPYMQPREVECVERLPLNANGKIDRGVLVEISSSC